MARSPGFADSNLTPELQRMHEEIRAYALDYGLDPFEIIFEMVDSDAINSLAAMGGFPVRYPHWRFGMDYDQFSKGYEWGLQKIYEMVINTDPSYAYLMKSNSLVDQKTVMAHVYGHVDFFKNNQWFSKTNRKMLDAMANHAVRIREFMDLHGQDKVEDFIDHCLAIGVLTHGVTCNLVGATAQAPIGMTDQLCRHVLKLQGGHGLVEGLQGLLELRRQLVTSIIDHVTQLLRRTMKPANQGLTGVVQQTLESLQVICGCHQVILQLGCHQQGNLSRRRRRGLRLFVGQHRDSTQPG